MTNLINDLRISLLRLRMKYMSCCKSGGADQNTKNAVVVHTNKHGGTLRLGNGPLTYTFGNTNQFRLPGKYAGVQCTSMALAAIIHQKSYPNLTPAGINAILAEGDKLHTRLRYAITTYKISNEYYICI
ncbi:uncharacterized protein LOC132739497 isoform X1 [Ruditapes philippinarum]|uniref:uncharacterized protein LOC132739497 isoform X1 n=1 Tax=Ruditapes philippinarum TaxID=129788 RepID=UPI00295ACE95|nr:uncharacterized protein LOC132739497 isoform X1 [Ruditapes philippinarum]